MSTETAPRAGRRPLPRKFTEPLSIQVTPSMRSELDAIADAEGITLAAAARDMLELGIAARRHRMD